MKNILVLSLLVFLLFLSSSLFFISAEVIEGTNLIETKAVAMVDASLAINNSEQIVQEMIENNFSILYVNDSLFEAKRVFEQARYASILRGDIDSTQFEKSEATSALRLIDWKNIDYGSVLIYFEDIEQRLEKAYFLFDEIVIEESKVSEVTSEETKNILESAKIAFREDRYNDAESLLIEFRVDFEQEKSELSTLSGIRNGVKTFFQRYWIHLLVFIFLILFIGYFIYRKFEKKFLSNRIRKMKIEDQVLIGLIKKAQEERFKKNSISSLVYGIRMKKYQERLQEIKEELPVLEKRFKKVK